MTAKSSPSNNLKERVEAILDDYTALNEGEFKGTTQKWWSFAVEPATSQVINLILDTILAKTDELDKTYRGQYKGPDGADVIRDFKAMLEGLKS